MALRRTGADPEAILPRALVNDPALVLHTAATRLPTVLKGTLKDALESRQDTNAVVLGANQIFLIH